MNITTAKQVLEAAAIADDSLLMEGPHGIGKSQIVEQFVEEQNYHLEVLFLSHQEVGDIIGIPHMIERDGVQITTWSKPIWLQRMERAAQEGKRCVLFLDELNRAPIDVRQSALQLVLERRIHEHELPIVNGERALVVSAINPADEYQVDELDPALLDRFIKIDVEADLKAWLDWGKHIPQVIRDFLIEYPGRLHYTPVADQENNGVGTSPRSWAKFADYVLKSDQIAPEILLHVMKGKLGTEVGSQFFTFYNNYVDIIKMEDIEKLVDEHKDKVKGIEEMGEVVYDLIHKTEAIQKTEMLDQLKEKYAHAEDITPFHAYLYAVETEIRVGFLRSMRKDDPAGYKNLVKHDELLNNKELFKAIVKGADSK